MFDLIMLCAISAGVFTFGKQALMNTAPCFLSAVRLIPAGLIFLLWSYIFDSKKQFSSLPNALPLFTASAFIYSLMDVSRFVSLKQISSSYGALISALAPFVAALIAYCFFKEVFSLKKVGALFLGFFGVLPLIVENISSVGPQDSMFPLLIGYTSMLLSVASYVVSTFIFKKLLDKNYSIAFVLGITLFFGGLLSLIASLCTETWNPVPLQNSEIAVPIIFLVFVTHGLIAQPLYGYIVKKYPVTLIAFSSLVTPLISALLDYFLYGQKIGYIFVFSLLTLMIAFYIFFNEEKQEKALK
jgi:drug/metabolite transporter (DMT)-like permease